ncbi:MAG: hypothetical protein JETT_2253 [Candidatus Jettenia ecosi]|uniref:Uncharacterized protein n=1 Tax=Candidatus Jettenia ecosi TaxID=2494326 RepID=A0A533Q9Y5_9BACT|nr:MAG: hypothetical protein JETT_2253 [Candidatus Jettenia ecosi]
MCISRVFGYHIASEGCLNELELLKAHSRKPSLGGMFDLAIVSKR